MVSRNRENKIKILIPVMNFGKAGGLRVLSQLANTWKEMGHQVYFVAYYKSEKPYYPIEANVLWINEKGKIVDTNICSSQSEKDGIKRSFALIKYLRKNSKNYNVVLANYNITAWIVWAGSKAVNFYYIQAYEVEFTQKRNIKDKIRKIVAYGSYLLPLKRVVNAEIYLKYKNLNAEVVIPPGLDLEIYYPKKTKRMENKELIVGCIGRTEEWKGTSDVVEAVRILHERGYGINFKVAFNPINYKNYELTKPDGDENLAEFYRSLDVLVAPGQIQLGAVHYPVIEAMACKTPVITTGYYPANMENAYIVPIKRPDVIANTIVEILEHYSNASNKAEIAFETISQFDWKIVSSKFLDLFYDENEE